ncbi:allantoinase AllB [Georgenia sp. Z1344]|uniref:allantoinase AllB n=1 Tax=Georgenia sp. Z1344 TaxID=3416706 RepID=UPI003CF9BCF3
MSEQSDVPTHGPGAVVADVNDPARIREQIRAFRTEHGLPDDDERPVPAGAGDAAPAGDAVRTREDGAFDLVLRGGRVLGEDGFAPREIGVRDGSIVAVEPLGAGLTGDRVVELAEDEVLISGLVDAHVHVNEPGRTEWEGFASATRAAAAGGVTTIVDMPLNSIPSTVNRPALEYKRLVAEPQAFVDVGLWGGAVPGNRADLRELHEDGVFGFKCFLSGSGVDEFPHLEADELEDYLGELASFGGMMIVHAEDDRSIGRAPQAEGATYKKFLDSRPRGAENLAIAQLIERTRWAGARSHVLHLSSSDALPMLRSAKADGVDISAETCPHYLALNAEDIADGATAFKCCPPIREDANRDLLWEGLLDGTIDYVASDHSPSTVELKDLEHGDFAVAWGGISSVQLELPIVWTEARRRGIPLERVVEWMSARPAARVGLARKGRIGVGYDADLAVLAPDDSFTVVAKELRHRNPISAYDGRELTGVVRRTFLRGDEVGDTPHGRLLRRGDA